MRRSDTHPCAHRVIRAQKRRKALKGKVVTVDSTVEGGMVFQEPVPRAKLMQEPGARVNGESLEVLGPYRDLCVLCVCVGGECG